MGRRGNPYDNAMMASLMKTLKVKDVYPLAFETASEVSDHLPTFTEKCNDNRLHSAIGHISPIQYEKLNSRPPVKSAA